LARYLRSSPAAFRCGLDWKEDEMKGHNATSNHGSGENPYAPCTGGWLPNCDDWRIDQRGRRNAEEDSVLRRLVQRPQHGTSTTNRPLVVISHVDRLTQSTHSEGIGRGQNSPRVTPQAL
jgi:hypothetical protein